MATAQEKAIINYRVHHCRTNIILKKSQFSPKVQRSGIPFLLQSLLRQVLPALRKKTTTVFSKIVTELAKLHTCCTFYVSLSL